MGGSKQYNNQIHVNLLFIIKKKKERIFYFNYSVRAISHENYIKSNECMGVSRQNELLEI